jgi:hypothetical protein
MMISKKVGILGSITAAALVCGVLSGCGGSSASVQGINVSVPVTGGVQNQGATLNTSVSSSTSPQQVQITAADGTTQTVVVPPGESFNAGDQAVVLAPNQPLLGGLTTGPRAHGTIKPQQSGDLPIYVDGLPSGVFLNALGALTLGLLLGPGNHTLSIQGAVTITGTSSTGSPSTLNVNKSITLSCRVNGIVASLPINLLGKLPGDGGSTANGNSITGDLLGFPVGYGELTLTWPGVSKDQKVPLRTKSDGFTGTFTFHDPLNNTDDTIPSTGIDTIFFGYLTHI